MGNVRLGRHLLTNRRQLELRRLELLQQRLAPDFQLLSRHAYVFEAGARDVDCRFRIDSPLIERAHPPFCVLDGRASGGELLLYFDTLL